MATSNQAEREVGRWWQVLGLKDESGELDFRMWLVTVPAIAMAVMSGPSSTTLTSHQWVNRTATFAALIALAMVYAVPVMAVVQRVAARSGSSDIPLACWWIVAGTVVGMSGGWMVACLSGAGAAVLMHLIFRQLAFEQARAPIGMSAIGMRPTAPGVREP